MSIERAATLRQAEKLLRQGKLELAIAEYLHLVADQPRDWNTANLLGDLYVRAGQTDHAVEQYSQVAESLRKEGFYAKASAVYKKILKLRPESDQVMLQAGVVAIEQGLLADARNFLTAALAGLRRHGDHRGALEVLVLLGGLDRHDVEARMAAAHARHQLNDVPGALSEFADLGMMLIDEKRDHEAVAPLREVMALDPGNSAVAQELGRILLAEGRTDEAASYLTPESVAGDPRLIMTLAELRLRRGETAAGVQLLESLLTNERSARPGVVELVLSLAPEQPDTAFRLLDQAVAQCVAESYGDGAAGYLRRFVARVPGHVPALARLVDLCVDGVVAEGLSDAQSMLADAYLAAGSVAEAKYIAEDLLTREPWVRAHAGRLRAAFAAEGHGDPDRALADWLAETPEFGLDDDLLSESVAVTPAAEEPAPVVSEVRAAPLRNPHAIDIELILGDPGEPVAPPRLDDEEDLSVALDEIHRPAEPPPAPAPPADLEAVFAQLREEAAQRPSEEAADVALTRGTAMYDAGQVDDAVEHLRTSARSPRRRHAAALLLAQIHEQQGRTEAALEWLGHAVDAPGVTSAERCDTLLRLADLLERSGEPASALAVCLELQADAGDYKDLDARIARLSLASGG